MRVFYFSEMAYHPSWEKGLARGSLRVNFPNENVDPQEAHKLLNRYLDEFALCDEVGIDIMVNEHHSTATCMTVSVPMALSSTATGASFTGVTVRLTVAVLLPRLPSLAW